MSAHPLGRADGSIGSGIELALVIFIPILRYTPAAHQNCICGSLVITMAARPTCIYSRVPPSASRSNWHDIISQPQRTSQSPPSIYTLELPVVLIVASVTIPGLVRAREARVIRRCPDLCRQIRSITEAHSQKGAIQLPCCTDRAAGKVPKMLCMP